MTLREFVFTETNHFVGMQQHAFFGKSIFLVLITKNFLIGLELNKKLNVEDTDTLFIQGTPKKDTPRGSLSNPYSYLKEKYVRAIERKYLYDESIFAMNKRNFRIDRIDIEAVKFNQAKINSLDYPHEGEIVISYTKRSKGLKIKKEINFILIGNQSINEVISNIRYQQLLQETA